MNRLSEIPPLNTQALLKSHGLKPDKKLGQNFLQDPLILADITRAAEISTSDTVMEIGAGLGGLTRYLAKSAKEVFAIEVDRRILPVLKSVIAGYPNIQLIHADILKVNPQQLISQTGYLVVANIPYYITSAVIRHLLESNPKPRRLVLTVQKEVARRICSTPGDLSLLALSVQVYGEPRIVSSIPAHAFYPSPNVDSEVIRIDVFPEPLIAPDHLADFFLLIKAGFGQKRKTLRNSLSAGLGISAPSAEKFLTLSGIEPQRRAETLSIPEWNQLALNLRFFNASPSA
jgi:16S rRNA (adenine1518-N6/adenine1519-N6)-dimethyltransferase